MRVHDIEACSGRHRRRKFDTKIHCDLSSCTWKSVFRCFVGFFESFVIKNQFLDVEIKKKYQILIIALNIDNFTHYETITCRLMIGQKFDFWEIFKHDSVILFFLFLSFFIYLFLYQVLHKTFLL